MSELNIILFEMKPVKYSIADKMDAMDIILVCVLFSIVTCDSFRNFRVQAEAISSTGSNATKYKVNI